MPYIRCPKEATHTGRFQDLIATMQNFSTLSAGIGHFTLLDRAHDKLPFLHKLLKWGSECYFERQMRTACRSIFYAWHNVKMFPIPRAKHPLLYTIVLKWWSGYEFCSELDVPSAPILPYSSHHDIAEVGIREII